MSRCGRVIDITGLVRPNDGQKKDSDGDDDKVIMNFIIKPKTRILCLMGRASL